jgi:hypothetical protein
MAKLKCVLKFVKMRLAKVFKLIAAADKILR